MCPNADVAPRWREQEAHHDTHAAADGDVLDPGQPNLPSGRLDDVEQDHHHRGERGLTGDERDHRRCDARNEHREREQHPEKGRVVGDTDHDDCADENAECSPADGSDGGRSGAERIGPQHRQRAEYHPEAVLDVGELDHQHGKGQPRPPRRALRNHTERKERWGRSLWA